MDSLRLEDHQELNIGIDGHINIDDNAVERNDNPSSDEEKGDSSVAGAGELGGGGKDMAPMAGNSIHRSSSRPQLNLSGAAIQGNFEEKDPSILLPNQSDDISHLALDIGGSLIKLVYFSRHENQRINDRRRKIIKALGINILNRWSYPILGGRLHFVKFETPKINECLDFIYSKQLHRGGMDSRHWQTEGSNTEYTIIKATGGGAYKFADLFKERLGISIEKEDEMTCLVSGANFLLKAIRHEAFTRGG